MTSRTTKGGRWSALIVVAALLFCACFVMVGADAYWAVALGRLIGNGSVPDGIPFAATSSGGWANVLVLGELLFAGLAAAGSVGLVIAQLVVDAVALVMLGIGARRTGASDGGTAVALALVVLGSLPALASVKLQVFSILLFPVLLLVLRADHASPSRRIWWVVLLTALWGNLHGAVLVGVALIGVYFALARLHRRPFETVAVGIATLLAVFANPAFLRSGSYYVGVLGNEAARRGSEMWSRPNPGNLFDLLLITAGLALVVLAVASRPPVWEVVAILGLCVATATAARHGVWLLMLCAAPAARRLTRHRETQRSSAWPLVVAGIATVVGCTALLVPRLDALNPSGDPALMAAVKQLAGDRAVLADEPVAESLAAAGIRVWMSNPLDAFSRADQAAYLDFVAGNLGPALNAADLVVARSQGAADRAVASDSRFSLAKSVAGWSIYLRVAAASSG